VLVVYLSDGARARESERERETPVAGSNEIIHPPPSRREGEKSPNRMLEFWHLLHSSRSSHAKKLWFLYCTFSSCSKKMIYFHTHVAQKVILLKFRLMKSGSQIGTFQFACHYFCIEKLFVTGSSCLRRGKKKDTATDLHNSIRALICGLRIFHSLLYFSSLFSWLRG
jgi:hypothetical protein